VKVLQYSLLNSPPQSSDTEVAELLDSLITVNNFLVLILCFTSFYLMPETLNTFKITW